MSIGRFVSSENSGLKCFLGKKHSQAAIVKENLETFQEWARVDVLRPQFNTVALNMLNTVVLSYRNCDLGDLSALAWHQHTFASGAPSLPRSRSSSPWGTPSAGFGRLGASSRQRITTIRKFTRWLVNLPHFTTASFDLRCSAVVNGNSQELSRRAKSVLHGHGAERLMFAPVNTRWVVSTTLKSCPHVTTCPSSCSDPKTSENPPN